MIMNSSSGNAHGFTLLECLVIIAVIVVLIVLAIPTKDRSRESTVVTCLNNQRTAAMGLFAWASEHGDTFPWRLRADHGGTLEFVACGDASPHFRLLSNYISKPRYLICPTDRARSEAASLVALANSNLSYFINLDATTNSSQMILTGDRHLETNGHPVKPGLLSPGRDAAIRWTRELHSKSAAEPAGVLSFTDGHVEQVKEKLTAYFARLHQITNRFAIP
jgi:hypothetical protein